MEYSIPEWLVFILSSIISFIVLFFVYDYFRYKCPFCHRKMRSEETTTDRLEKQICDNCQGYRFRSHFWFLRNHN